MKKLFKATVITQYEDFFYIYAEENSHKNIDDIAYDCVHRILDIDKDRLLDMDIESEELTSENIYLDRDCLYEFPVDEYGLICNETIDQIINKDNKSESELHFLI